MMITSDRTQYRTLVAEVAARAKERLPQAVNGRVESAVKLVLLHDVTPQADGSILVGSSTDPMKTYRLEGSSCTCQDFAHSRAPAGWCSHRIAAGLHKRVHELLPTTPGAPPESAAAERATPPAPVTPPVEPWPDNDPGPVEEVLGDPEPPAPAPLPEAAFSLTLKGTLDGVEALLTARGATAAEFRANLEAVRGLLDARPQPATSAPSQGTGWCAVHQVAMPQNVKDGRTWYSHRTPDGQWCKGR